MMTTPLLGLTVAYWLHMLATVVWIGSLAGLALVVLPAANRMLEPRSFHALLEGVQRRLDPLGWFCLLVLTGSGLFQMSASPNYQGFLNFQNSWAAAILIKHIVFLGMIAINAWSTWGILPALRRAVLRQSMGKEVPQANRLVNRSLLFLRLNLGLSALVLALTALARVS